MIRETSLDILTSAVMLTPAGLPALNSQSYLDPSCYREMILNNHSTTNILRIREKKEGNIFIFRGEGG